MSNRFEILATPLPGLQLLQRSPLGDERGYLERLFCIEDLQAILSGKNIAQINRTHTADRGTVRGLHFQHAPHAETKFITCLRGRVFDVAVDLRTNSPTLLHWHAEILSAEDHRTLVIPEGFAHGFQTLTDDCEMLYFHTARYHSEAEAGLNVSDPRIGISWPLPVAGLSPRDAGQPFLTDDSIGIES